MRIREHCWKFVVALSIIVSVIDGSAAGAEHVVLNPADFTTEVTNPYFPLPVGVVRVYAGEETDDEGVVHQYRVEERVLSEPHTVMDIAVVVMEVTELRNGELIEITRDYHAQHRDGSVWYFGENVDNYENGELIDHEGSWIAGEGDSEAGVSMPADPRVFDTVQQERAPGEAEDWSTIVETGLALTVPAGWFDNCLKTVDVNPLESTSEFKFYCPGIGLVREQNADGVTELVTLEGAA